MKPWQSPKQQEIRKEQKEQHREHTWEKNQAVTTRRYFSEKSSSNCAIAVLALEVECCNDEAGMRKHSHGHRRGSHQ